MAKILLISQVYAPDPAAIARLMADVGTGLSLRGNQVIVLTAERGYDNPTLVHPSGMTPEGVVVTRLPYCSFGKRSMLLRILAGLSFTLQAALRGVLMRGLDGVVVSTTPPMGALAAVIIGWLRRVRLVYWPMDLNPDQALALGLATPSAVSVRLLEWLNRAILRQAVAVIALDRIMARRLEAKVPVLDKLIVVPPWPEEDGAEPVPHEDNPFRHEHDLDGKTVVMYSGTLGPSNPVDTLLAAARQFEDDPRLLFVFVGGGTGMAEVRAMGLRNLRCLPYEPLSRMRYSLSAADVHIVSLGEQMLGIVHPCKVYGAMATARPILFLGPADSHVTDMMTEAAFGWHVSHGDVQGAVRALREIIETSRGTLEEMGRRGRGLIERGRTRAISAGRVVEIIERAVDGTERFDATRFAGATAGRVPVVSA